jgi:capsid protein
VEAAQAAGELPQEAEITADWTAPRFEAVDPLKDIQADVLAVRAGVMTLKEAIARQGYEPAQVLREIAQTNAELDALGLILDSDPRRSTKTGQDSGRAPEGAETASNMAKGNTDEQDDSAA